MNLAFAMDSKRFSKAVETIRKERGEFSEENIKRVYDSLGEEKEAEPVQEPAKEVAPAEEPKAVKKPARRRKA